jgi:ABC-type lipoprotein release transport system permease subunit
MTPVPAVYVMRNLAHRALATTLTALGIALAAFVLAALLMTAAGLADALVDSASPGNAIFVRQPAASETRSAIARTDAVRVESLAGFARDRHGDAWVVKELAVPVAILRDVGDRGLPAVFRGTTATGQSLRDHAVLADGRLFRPMSDEIVVGAQVARALQLRSGDSPGIGPRQWRVVGVFRGSNTALDNEIWGDIDAVMQAFRRTHFSSVLARVEAPGALPGLARAIADDLRSELAVYDEREFYRAQTVAPTRFLHLFASFMGAVFGVAAITGGIITMHAAVDRRTREIGTLRALGFEPRSILVAILGEATCIGLAGGMLGLGAAGLLSGAPLTALNIGSGTDLTFRLALEPQAAAIALLFAAGMGVAGGFPPALRAMRLRVVDALRAPG